MQVRAVAILARVASWTARFATSGLVLLTSLALAGCYPGDPGQRGEIGVRSAADGSIEFRVEYCEPGLKTESLQVRSGITGAGQEGKVVWEISASQDGGSLTEATLGADTPPSGFRTTTVLQGELRADDNYVVQANPVGRLAVLGSFRPAQLQRSWLTLDGRPLSDEAFTDYVQEQCRKTAP